MFVLVTALVILLQPQLLLGAHDQVEFGRIRQLAARNNVSCVLVFGDSSVDPGNNNVLHTTMKGNFPPYGKNFFGGRPTGRFSDGRLATDFIAEAIGYTKIVPAFLDPNLKESDMVHGVSFASAASGYDDYTANISNVLPLSEQLKYFLHFKLKLRRFLGDKRAEDTIRNAIFVISMGTNDFLQDYYLDPTRPHQFTLDAYQNYLVSRMAHYIQEMHRVGGQRLVVVGVPPLGCMPLVKALMDQTKCVDSYNKLAASFNSKISHKLASLKSTFRMKLAFVDAYGIVVNAMNNPQKYGIEETSKGCCGTGTIEYGDSCKGLETCKDPTKYVFWDAVHPTQKMYKIIADEAVESVNANLFV
ncbi:Lipase [Trema orientale]|uniref:Lipase n=1 Tax=Trema orientale TaxID=63057 RepID=A0A2P5C8R9_TREOI|nr:Lipase [Trema orientale]